MHQAQFEDLKIRCMKADRYEPDSRNHKPDIGLHRICLEREHHSVKPLGCYGNKALNGDSSGHVLEEIGEFTKDKTSCAPNKPSLSADQYFYDHSWNAKEGKEEVRCSHVNDKEIGGRPHARVPVDDQYYQSVSHQRDDKDDTVGCGLNSF